MATGEIQRSWWSVFGQYITQAFCLVVVQVMRQSALCKSNLREGCWAASTLLRLSLCCAAGCGLCILRVRSTRAVGSGGDEVDAGMQQPPLCRAQPSGDKLQAMSHFGLCLKLISWAVCSLWAGKRSLVMPAAAGVSCSAAGGQWGGLLCAVELPEQMPGQPHLAGTGHRCGDCAHIAGEPFTVCPSSATGLSEKLSAHSIIWLVGKGCVRQALTLMHVCQLQLFV